MGAYVQQDHQDSDSLHALAEVIDASFHQVLHDVCVEQKIECARRRRKSLVDFGPLHLLLAPHLVLSPKETPSWQATRK
jgi:hypothetical protein